jgi:FkbM family methyltransferase
MGRAMAAEHDVDRGRARCVLRWGDGGVLVEIGAARPDYLSISASYRALGWKIIAIEANPEFCAAHGALGYDVLMYAVRDTEADDAKFFVVDSLGSNYMGGTVSFESFSSLGIQGKYADLHETVKARTKAKTIPVKIRRLDTILATHEPNLHVIDILAVDVEGWELNVMRGLTLERASQLFPLASITPVDFQRRDPKQASGGARPRSIPRAGLSRYGGRHHLVMVGDIIPLRRATSSRHDGRLGQESAVYSRTCRMWPTERSFPYSRIGLKASPTSRFFRKLLVRRTGPPSSARMLHKVQSWRPSGR